LKSVGVIGVGSMGAPMAKNLLQAGFRVCVYDKRSKALDPLVSIGAQSARSPSELAKRSEVAITMLPSPTAVEEAVLGVKGAIEGVSKGKILVEMSTIDPSTVQRVGRSVSATGAEFLDATVNGIPPVAEQGQLVIMAGGKVEVIDRCMDIFSALGKSVIRVGEIGDAKKCKLAGNMLIAIQMVAASELAAWIKTAGLDLQLFCQVFHNSFRDEETYNRFRSINEGRFRGGPNWAHKDLGLGLEVASQLGIPMPLAAVARSIHQAAKVMQGEDRGLLGTVRFYESITGARLSPQDAPGSAKGSRTKG